MASVRVIKKKTITIGDGVMGEISLQTLNVLADIMQASNINSCTITSAVRDSFNQARVMYDALRVEGVGYWKTVYGRNGDAVIDVYVAETSRGSDRDTTISAMQARIDQFLSQGIRVSRHMGDPNVLQVLDIAKSSLSNVNSFTRAVRQSVSYFRAGDDRGRVSLYIDENRSVHVEIPQVVQELQEGESRTEIPQNSPPEVSNEVSVIRYIHPRGDGATTLYELIKDPKFIGYDINGSVAYSFEWEGKSNNERLWESLTMGNKKRLGGNTDGAYNPNVNYPVVPGVTVYFPTSAVTVGARESRVDVQSTLEVVGNIRVDEESSPESTAGTPDGSSQINTYSSNITTEKIRESTLFPFVLRKLSLDPGYVPAYNNRGIITKDVYPHISVMAWSKVLEAHTGNGYIDITADVISCNIGSRMGGGDFSIELQPKVGYLNGTEGDIPNRNSWEVKGAIGTIDGESISINNVNREKLYVDSRVPDGRIGSEYRRNHMYYNMIFQQNDMVWIKFERLGFEDKSALDNNRFGEWYDMIGLIDVSPVGINSKNTDSRVMIRGRDLTKVLEDDNAYFNPYSIGHASSVYGDSPHANGRYENGSFKDLAAIQARSIQQSIEFIFHRIASIGYVPDNIFRNLQDPTIITRINRGDTNERKPVRGIWQCIKLFIDESIKDLRVVDDSISNPDGSILDLINKVCQDPFVEFFTDTYGDKFYMIARKPPFEGSVVRDIVNQVAQIDSGDGQVVGGAISSPRSNSYREYLDAKEDTESGGSEITESEFQYTELSQSLGEAEIVDRKFPLIINIGEDDVDTDQLEFSNESYSWYQVTDRGNFAGANINLGHIPSLYFDEIAQIFGNRRLEVVSNYSNYRFFQSNKSSREVDLYADQASQHLAFLVETNIHLPFTRKGTITLNIGDRRIRKGNYIYYRPTQEIFYVTGVSNSASISRGGIDRATVIEVERGMVLAYVKGSYEPVLQEDGTYRDVEISYFNIADIPRLRDGVRDAVTNGTADDKFDYQSNISINKDVMNFFLERRQFKQFD